MMATRLTIIGSRETTAALNVAAFSPPHVLTGAVNCACIPYGNKGQWLYTLALLTQCVPLGIE